MRMFVEAYLDNLGTLSIIVAILSAFGQIMSRVTRRAGLDLQMVIQKTLAGAAIPIGLALMLCAFDTSLLRRIHNSEVYILISGISILYISLIGVFPEIGFHPPTPPAPPTPTRRRPPPAPPGSA
jgi:hypothetical protein